MHPPQATRHETYYYEASLAKHRIAIIEVIELFIWCGAIAAAYIIAALLIG